MGMITYKYPPFESKKYRYNCVKVSKKRGSAIDVCAGAVITLMEREIFWIYLIKKVKIKPICHLPYKNYERINHDINSYPACSS